MVSNIITTGTGFNSERFSDSFATIYGYGPELISALNKFEPDISGMVQTGDNYVMDTLSCIGTQSLSLLHMIIDPHPENQTRCKMILEDTKRLSENPNFDPKIRKILKADYEKAKKCYDAFSKQDKTKTKNVALIFSRSLKEKYFGGKIDFRSLIFRASAIEGEAINKK